MTVLCKLVVPETSKPAKCAVPVVVMLPTDIFNASRLPTTISALLESTTPTNDEDTSLPYPSINHHL